MEEGLPPEHPRASTTDDVECFFSMLRDCVGKHFTVKQVQYEFRKLCLEFMKRTDPDLPYFYFTSAHDRFQEGSLPDFDQPSRTSMVTPGSLSVRARFHQVPIELPPPPATDIHTYEHSYC